MNENFGKEISNVKYKETILQIVFEINSQKMRTFEQNYYFCTLKSTVLWR